MLIDPALQPVYATLHPGSARYMVVALAVADLLTTEVVLNIDYNFRGELRTRKYDEEGLKLWLFQYRAHACWNDDEHDPRLPLTAYLSLLVNRTDVTILRRDLLIAHQDRCINPTDEEFLQYYGIGNSELKDDLRTRVELLDQGLNSRMHAAMRNNVEAIAAG